MKAVHELFRSQADILQKIKKYFLTPKSKTMKKQTAVFLICAFLMPLTARCADLDSLLSAKIAVQKPYLIINVTSTDCINCRMGGVAILNKLKGSSYKDKIVVVSDDKNMSLYFQDNADKYDGYKKIYDRRLSRALSQGPSCTASLVAESGTHTYLFKGITDDTLNYFKQVLDNKGDAGTNSDVVRDTAMSDVSNMYWGKDYVLLYNDRFQLGLRYDRTARTVNYMRPSIGDAAANNIYNLARNAGIKGIADAKIARLTTHMVGMSMVLVNGIEPTDNSAMFKLFEVKTDTTINGTDTNVNSNIYNQMVLARNLDNKSDPFSAGNYASYTLFDSVVHAGKKYVPSQTLDYQEQNGHYFIAFHHTDDNSFIMDHGRKIFVPRDLVIADFSCKEDGRAEINKVYDVDTYEAEGCPGFFFRISDAGVPVAVSNDKKTIAFLNGDHRVFFSSLIYAAGDTVSKVFDIRVEGDELRFAGMTDKNNCVKGSVNMATRKVAVTKLNSEAIYQNIKINGRAILACRKNEETNELIFDQFTF